MSYVDPVQQAAERRQAAQGSPGSVVRTAVLGLVLLGLSAVFGVTGGIVLGGSWWSMYVYDGDVGPVGPFAAAFIVSILVISVVAKAYRTSVERLAGGRNASGQLIIRWIGAGLGFWYVIESWTGPVRVGYDEDGDAWWQTGWVLYNITQWWPAIFFGVLVLLVVLAVVATRKRRHDLDHADRLTREGVTVPGTVTDVRYTALYIQGQQMVHYVVHFRDHLGADRWVKGQSTFAGPTGPRQGDPANVRYDPAVMSEEKDFSVTLAGHGPAHQAGPASSYGTPQPGGAWQGPAPQGGWQAPPPQGGAWQGAPPQHGGPWQG